MNDSLREDPEDFEDFRRMVDFLVDEGKYPADPPWGVVEADVHPTT